MTHAERDSHQIVRAALAELVRLKRLKDKWKRPWGGCPLYGPGSWSKAGEKHRLDYERNQPLAWKAARKALKEIS